MQLPQAGGCQCGAVRYEITMQPRFAYTCHCRDCQRISGSAFSVVLVLDADALAPHQGEYRAFQRVTETGRTATRWACARCGTVICAGAKPGFAAAGSLVIMQAGSLDDTSWVRPIAHVWTRSKQPWVTLPEGDPCFDTRPPDPGWRQAPEKLRSLALRAKG